MQNLTSHVVVYNGEFILCSSPTPPEYDGTNHKVNRKKLHLFKSTDLITWTFWKIVEEVPDTTTTFVNDDLPNYPIGDGYVFEPTLKIDGTRILVTYSYLQYSPELVRLKIKSTSLLN